MMSEASKAYTVRHVYLTSACLCLGICVAFYLLCHHRRNMLIDLSIDGVNVDAVLRDAGVDVDGNLQVVLSVPDSVDVIRRLNRKGIELRKIPKIIPEIKKTYYPLTTESPYVINNPNICKNITELKFIIIVHSATKNFQKRRLIRETWANKNIFKTINLRILFLFGLTEDKKIQSLIENESVVYGDIVQGNFLDTYHNLTHKGVLSYRWISEHCLNAEAVLKVDDDVFINPFLLLEQFYPRLKAKERHIMCHLRKQGSSPIIRGHGKWRVEDDQFRGYKFYPFPYCNGYVVLISPEIIRAMYRASFFTPFFWVDDVYLYGLLPLKAGHISHEEIRNNLTLSSDKGLQCYTKTKNCTYLAVNTFKSGTIETLWYSSLKQISPGMKKHVTSDFLWS